MAGRAGLGVYGRSWASAGQSGQRLLIGGFLCSIRAYIFAVAFPLFGNERGMDNDEIGFLIAAASFTLFLLGVPVTILGSRGLSRQLLVIGPVLSAIGIGMLAIFPSDATWWLRLGAFLAGCSAASFWILVDPMLADVTPEDERVHIYALKFFVVTFGFAIGGGLGGWIPGVLESAAGLSHIDALTVTLFVVAALDLVSSLTFASVRAVSPQNASNQPGTPSTRVPGIPTWLFWLLMIALVVPEMFMSTGHNSIRPFLSLYFDEVWGLGASAIGAIMLIAALLSGCGALATPRIAARFGNLPTIGGLRLVAGALILVWFAGVPLWVVVGLLFLHQLLIDGTQAIFVAEAMSRVPISHRTWFSGMYGMGWSLASFAAASVSGVIQESRGFQAAFFIGAGGYVCSALWILLVYPRLPRLHRPVAAASAS